MPGQSRYIYRTIKQITSNYLTAGLRPGGCSRWLPGNSPEL